MKKRTENNPYADDQLGCSLEFSMKDPICRNYCALRLSCAIRHEQDLDMEVLEDLLDAYKFNVT